MAQFNVRDTEKYGGQGGGGFFSLRNNGDFARVRFMYDTVDDIMGYSVHEITLNGKKRNVDCLKHYDEPVYCCPFCRAGKPQMVKIFIPLYMEDEGRVCTWERGKTWIKKIAALCEQHAQNRSMASVVFEIRKVAVEGSVAGTFEITPLYADDMNVEEFGVEFPNVEGGIVLNKDFDEMEDYLETGDFRKAEKMEFSDWLHPSRRFKAV